MGSASCKNPKSSEQNQKKDDIKNITIGVFGLDNAGKTSTVKAIEGAPTKNVEPTMSSDTSTVPFPGATKGNNKSQERIKIIDVSGSQKFRERSWSEFYDQIHGFIFVIDASERKRIIENKHTLEDLLDNEKLKNKPILILANKQDRKGAIDDEDVLKEKLEIEKLKAKHKINFCTALPIDKNKADEHIRDGFSWLIKEIDTNYTELNSRVKNTKKSTPPKPTERKPQRNPRSSVSNSDDEVVYAGGRTKSPALNPKHRDFRSSNDLSKLPAVALNKPKTKTSGYDTYSEGENDDYNKKRLGSRPNISSSPPPESDRNRPLNVTSLASTSGFNKKKKVIGASNTSNIDQLIKKPSTNEPKSFRSSYEPFPEEAPWSSSMIKTTKHDENMPPKPYSKLPLTGDPMKRNLSPLVHDTKPYSKSPISKNDFGSDDDDLYKKEKPKPSYPPINRFKDNDNLKYPSSTVSRPTSGRFNANRDDDDVKLDNTLRRSNFTTPTKDPYKPYDNSDDEKSYTKKTPYKPTKTFDPDEDLRSNDKNKPYQSSLDRFKPNNDYYGTTSKPLPSSTTTGLRSRYDEDKFSSPINPVNRSRFGNDDYSSPLSKPKVRTTSDDDDDRPSSTSKFNTQSKYDNNYKSQSKPIVSSKYDDDDDDLPSSTTKLGTTSKYGYDNTMSSKPTTRLKQDDYDRPSSPARLATRSKYDDDNRSVSPMTSASRSKYGDENRFSPSVKPITRSKFSDDDDDLPKYPTKVPPKSKFDDDDDDRPKLSSKVPPSRSKYGDDDDDLPKYPTKVPPRSKYEDDDDRPKLSSKVPLSRSKYSDDDDLPKYPTKVPSRSKFDDDDDLPRNTSKPPSRSKYEDDDDDRPKLSSKVPPSRSKYSDDDDLPKYPTKVSSRSKYEDDDDDRPKLSSKVPSRSKFDDDDDLPRNSSKAPTRSKYEDDDDDDRPKLSSKVPSRSKFDDDDDLPKYSSKAPSSSKFEDDDYNNGGSARSRFANNTSDSSRNGTNNTRIGSAATNRFRTNANSDY
ncbi:unnamed protein product [Adineta steineri]|uniref:Uncharacterized protein n=1 Tax=Adineta steineri TaxID=433720 RepID=A0A813NWH3_9BILA|nr:unnamed protein product [Adineta steineri]